MSTFEVWQTISVGGLAEEALMKEFEKQKIRLEFPETIVTRALTEQPQQPQTVAFSLVRGHEIGVDRVTEPDTILNGRYLERFGLALCLPYDGIYLRLGVSYQKHSDCFDTGMRPLEIGDAFGIRFLLYRHKGIRARYLGKIYHCKDFKIAPTDLLIFRNIPLDFMI